MRYSRLVLPLSVLSMVVLSACGSTAKPSSDLVERVDVNQLKAPVEICDHFKLTAKPAKKCLSKTTKLTLKLDVPSGWQAYRFGLVDQDGAKHMLSTQVQNNCRLLVAINLGNKGSDNLITERGIKRAAAHGKVAGGGNWAINAQGRGWLAMQAGPKQNDNQGAWYPVWTLATYVIQNSKGQMDPQTLDCKTDQSAWAKQATQQLFKQVKLEKS